MTTEYQHMLHATLRQHRNDPHSPWRKMESTSTPHKANTSVDEELVRNITPRKQVVFNASHEYLVSEEKSKSDHIEEKC
jgi:hypothetical protein